MTNLDIWRSANILLKRYGSEAVFMGAIKSFVQWRSRRRAIGAFAGRASSPGINQNPRKTFNEAVDYAIQLSNGYLGYLKRRSIKIEGLRYLEIGPGTDFAPQLIL